MNKNHIPIRMCVICRARFEKFTLHKFKESSTNRSFYICKKCIDTDVRFLKKRLIKQVKFNNLDDENFKEKLLNGECPHK